MHATGRQKSQRAMNYRHKIIQRRPTLGFAMNTLAYIRSHAACDRMYLRACARRVCGFIRVCGTTHHNKQFTHDNKLDNGEGAFFIGLNLKARKSQHQNVTQKHVIKTLRLP